MTDETYDSIDEYGTAYFSDIEFDGWIAKRGHGAIRRGDHIIHLDSVAEMKALAKILNDMVAHHEGNRPKKSYRVIDSTGDAP